MKKVYIFLFLFLFLLFLNGCFINKKEKVFNQYENVTEVVDNCEIFWWLKICKSRWRYNVYSGNKLILSVAKDAKNFEIVGEKIFYLNSGGKLIVIDWITLNKRILNNCIKWNWRFICYDWNNVKGMGKYIDLKVIDNINKLVNWIWWVRVKKEILTSKLKIQDLEKFFKKSNVYSHFWEKHIIFWSWGRYYKMNIDGDITGINLTFKLDKLLFVRSVYSPDLCNYYWGCYNSYYWGCYNSDVCDNLWNPWPCWMKVFVDYFNSGDRYLYYKWTFSKDIKVSLNDKTYWLLGDFLGNLYTYKDSNHYENGCYILIDSEYKDGYWEYTIYRNRWSLVDTGENCKLEGVTKIWVFWEHNGKRDEEYILKSYNPKTWTFKYKISERYWNYSASGGKYIFRFYLSGWGYTEYVIDFDYLAKYKDFCLRPTKQFLKNFLNGKEKIKYITIDYWDNWWKLIESVFNLSSKKVCLTYGREYGEEDKIFIMDDNIILKDFKISSGYEYIYFKRIDNDLWGWTYNYIRHFSWFEIRKVVDLACTTNIAQGIYKNWKLYTGLDIGLLPKVYKINWIFYKLVSYNLTWSFYKDGCIAWNDDYSWFCISFSWDSILYEKYFVSSWWVVWFYTIPKDLKEKLGNPSFIEWISHFVGYYIVTGDYRDWVVKDVLKTKEIINKIWKWRVDYIVKFGKNTKYLSKILSWLTLKDLPIFKLTKIWKNKFAVSLVNGWIAVNWPDWICKPAVYFYWWSWENTLNVVFNSLGYIKDLIPDFNIPGGWRFKIKNNKVFVDGNQYPYLYYSAIVFNYKWNKLWWIVRWEDVEKFFKDKLVKIGFNKKELDDFLEYWVKKYKKGKYYFISFKYNKDFDKYIKLKFKNEPYNIIRVLMESYIVGSWNFDRKFLYPSKYEKFLEKKLIRKFKRTYNKEVFERWGSLWNGKSFWVY